MIIHCKCTSAPVESGVKVGKCQVWAEGCEDNLDKMLAQCIGQFIKSGVEGLNEMAEHLFTPPKEGGAK